ncbi:MAG: sporulation protein YqfD [Clostridia bacterium]|nr:sporulation protein YqfD [Clostridium sp.]
MIFKNLESYISGYLRINIEGYYIERFINICRKENIPVWNIKKEKDIRLAFNIKIKDFKKICKIAKTTKCKLKIKKKKGFPFILNRYKKRKIFAIFLILVIILIVMSSNYVWNIEVIEENGNNLENIMQNLNQSGLAVGKRKSEINTKEVINKVRLERNDIAWMGIELKGTNAIVKVVKSDEKPDIIDENEYCSIVADKAGIITKISAQDGTANVKVGDTINEGETLINGWVEGKYTGIRYVHAKGEIQAKVWYTKHKFIEYNTTEKRETGNQEEKYAIKFNNFKINLGKGVSKFEIYDTIETENKFKIFSDFYLPISIVKTTNKEIENVQKKYNKEEAKMLGIKELEEELNNEIENKDNIVNKNINTYENENGLDVYVTYEVLENIGTNEKIVF